MIEEDKVKVEFTEAPPVGDESILSEVLDGKAMVNMSDEEINERISKLRQMMETPATLRKALTGKKDAAKAKPKRATVDKTKLLDLLGGLD